MDDTTNCEKLATVFNRAGDQGKGAFCKMLWGNQSDLVRTQLKPLLSANTLELLSPLGQREDFPPLPTPNTQSASENPDAQFDQP